jgi:hypothetical protein
MPLAQAANSIQASTNASSLPADTSHVPVV